jgi:hypothetical protein
MFAHRSCCDDHAILNWKGFSHFHFHHIRGR